MIRVRLDQGQVRATIEGIQARAKNLRPVLDDFAAHMEGSILQNFIDEGRPDKWKKSGAEKTLTRSGRLRNSVTSKVTATDLVMGSNAKQGRLLHKGGVVKPKKAKALAIPLQDWIRGGPRRYNDLVYLPPKKGDPDSRGLLGKASGDDIQPMFALRAKAVFEPRPWLLFQDEDRDYAKAQVSTYLRTGEI